MKRSSPTNAHTEWTVSFSPQASKVTSNQSSMNCTSPKSANIESCEDGCDLRHAREDLELSYAIEQRSSKIVVEFDSSLLLPDFCDNQSRFLGAEDDLELMMASTVLTDFTDVMDELDDQTLSWMDPQSLVSGFPPCNQISFQTMPESLKSILSSSLHSIMSKESSPER